MGEGGSIQPQVKDLAFQFAVTLVRFLKRIPRSAMELELLRQLICSGTSIGANIEEAEGARTKPEFINGMNIAKREARETVYWLRLIKSVRESDQETLAALLAQAESLLRMLTAIVKTSESRRISPVTHR